MPEEGRHQRANHEWVHGILEFEEESGLSEQVSSSRASLRPQLTSFSVTCTPTAFRMKPLDENNKRLQPPNVTIRQQHKRRPAANQLGRD